MKMNFTYLLGFVVLRDVVKVFPVSSSSFARTTPGRNRAWSHSGAWRGLKTKWDLKLSLPSPTSHPILVYLSQNNNSLAQARRFPPLAALEPEFSVVFGSKWDLLTRCVAPGRRQSRETRWTSDGRLSSPETNLKVGLLPLIFMKVLLSHMFLSFMVRTSPLTFHRLDYLYETWHTCSRCIWLQKMPEIF